MKDVFPFLELAPELRNRIYEYSLSHDRAEHQVANVALLRVNRQINDEAKKMLPHLVHSLSLILQYDKSERAPVYLAGDIKASITKMPTPNIFSPLMGHLLRTLPRIYLIVDLPGWPDRESSKPRYAAHFIELLIEVLLQAQTKQDIYFAFVGGKEHAAHLHLVLGFYQLIVMKEANLQLMPPAGNI